MPTSMLCGQCRAPAERCVRCGAALCLKKFCAELHEAACDALSALPGELLTETETEPRPVPQPTKRPRVEVDQQIVDSLILTIAQHRADGRAALLVGELDQAFSELSAAREMELQLDRLGRAAARALPEGWELETDLTPLARALSAANHARASEAWRRVLEDGPARSIQAEAAEWLAREAFASGDVRLGLRTLHARSRLGRAVEVSETFAAAYRQAGLDVADAFALYLRATRLDGGSARAAGLRDPLTDQPWADQDPRWWRVPSALGCSRAADRPGESEHQQEALARARDLVQTRRDQGWWLLAEGDSLAGPLGARSLGRSIRSGASEAADHDAVVRLRLAYEGAAERLPDVAWPWYRLAELMAWSGFAERAQAHLAQAERRSLGSREADRTHRPVLRGLVEAGLGGGSAQAVAAARPFPAEPFGPTLAWRLGLR
jgi:hypothetical protein